MENHFYKNRNESKHSSRHVEIGVFDKDSIYIYWLGLQGRFKSTSRRCSSSLAISSRFLIIWASMQTNFDWGRVELKLELSLKSLDWIQIRVEKCLLCYLLSICETLAPMPGCFVVIDSRLEVRVVTDHCWVYEYHGVYNGVEHVWRSREEKTRLWEKRRWWATIIVREKRRDEKREDESVSEEKMMREDNSVREETHRRCCYVVWNSSARKESASLHSRPSSVHRANWQQPSGQSAPT